MKNFKLIIVLLFSLVALTIVFFILKKEGSVNLPNLQVKIATLPVSTFTLGFAGEIILARDVATKINQYHDYTYPFHQVADITRIPDLFFATLEAPLYGKNTPCGQDCLKFIADGETIEGLKFAGIDVVSLAANHVMDGDEAALENTLKLLDEVRIGHVGAGLSEAETLRPFIKEIRGLKVGFLAYNEIPPQKNTATALNLSQAIRDLKKKVDLVIVSFHWGIEYTDQPNDSQKALAHQAIDADADLVIGDHPHWLQGIEFYQGKPIFYSVGNFIFDQMWSRETREGIMVFLTFEGTKLSRVQLKPHLIENFSQPRPLLGEEKEKILNRLYQISEPTAVTKLKMLE